MHASIDFISGLIFCNGKKVCIKLGEAIDKSHDTLYRVLGNKEIMETTKQALLKIVREILSREEQSIYILDDTALSKRFARFIEGIAHIYDEALGRSERGLCIVVLAWSNGSVTIPVSFKFWFSKEIVGEVAYKIKKDIARELILEMLPMLRCDFLLMDGLYCDIEMIKFCNKHGVKFEMKIAKNRVVITKNGSREQIKKHQQLKLKRNEHVRTVCVAWQDVTIFITTVKRKIKDGYSLLYLASNANITPHEHFARYKIRWDIELFFRTAKQSLGLADCASRKIEYQTNHICHILLTYAFLQQNRYIGQYKNPEAVLNQLRDAKSSYLNSSLKRLDHILHAVA